MYRSSGKAQARDEFPIPALIVFRVIATAGVGGMQLNPERKRRLLRFLGYRLLSALRS